MTVPSPFVYWAQNEKTLFLKIDLKDAEDVDVRLSKRNLQFSSKGSGAHGLKNYAFSLNFKWDIDVEESIYKVTGHKVDFIITKAENGWWPRLISKPQKPAWLKIDFDRWQTEEDFNEEEVRDIQEDYPDLYDKLHKQEMGYRKEDFKKVYLTLYNLLMYVGFMYVVIVLCIRFARDGTESYPGTYEAVGPAVIFLQLLQFLEVMHPIFGYVKSGVLMPAMQVSGRFIVIFFMVEKEPRIQKMPVVFYLLLTWSAVEIIRYPYYMSQLHKKENGILTWLRYTVWIFLYPIGFLCESVIIFRNLIFIEHSGKWSVSMPNTLNFTFHVPTILRFYLLIAMIPSSFTLMSHMYKARVQRLGSKKGKFRKS
ncbi:unnamed protein product [Brassicogethes aeneus]|uniref:Very-long-chain (3R)-3-hydroxyacyl-CoA dehydratase n=1 Tax=Brassicogethes aeneus TaxID=1431903 RepID=A0A9P0AXJ9_BRAAE|nr:unnamed protein product [Brassicogethes aeneus]